MFRKFIPLLQNNLKDLPPKLLLTLSTMHRTLRYLQPLSLIHITFQASSDFTLTVCAVTNCKRDGITSYPRACTSLFDCNNRYTGCELQ